MCDQDKRLIEHNVTHKRLYEVSKHEALKVLSQILFSNNVFHLTLSLTTK